MRANPIGHDRHGVTARSHFSSCSPGNRINNDSVHTEGEVVAVLFRVTDRDENDLATFRIRWKDQTGFVGLRVRLPQEMGRQPRNEKTLRVEALRRKAIYLCKAIVTQAVQQVFDVGSEDGFWNLKPAATPAKREGGQESDTGRMAQLVSEQFKVIA